MSYVFLDVIEAGMDTNDEVRRRRLERLCRETPGGLTGVAALADVSRASLDQILKRVLLPAREGGVRSPRSLGDLAARKIESALDLAPGWLDWPFDAVDFASYTILTDLDRGAVQARMMAAIEDRLKSPIYGEFAKSDKAGKPDSKDLHSHQKKAQDENEPLVFGPALTAAFSFGRDVKNGKTNKAAATPKKRSGSNS
jgi:hypothetical protein